MNYERIGQQWLYTGRSSEPVYSILRNYHVMSTTVRIVKTPDNLHGKPRIEGTRIGVFHIGELVHQHDSSLEDVAHEFDLDIGTVEAALDYYDEHPELVETLRAQHEAGC